MVDQRVARDARFGLVGFRESPVYHHQFAVRLDGFFAFYRFYGHMSVDDVTVLAFNAEFVQYHVADVFAVAQLVIIAFCFHVGFLVADEIPLEGCHLVFVEGGRVFSAPQVPHIV